MAGPRSHCIGTRRTGAVRQTHRRPSRAMGAALRRGHDRTVRYIGIRCTGAVYQDHRSP